MNLAVCLLAYAVALTVLGPPLLSRATRDGAAPRLAVAAWLIAMASVLAASVAAVALFIIQILFSWGRIGAALTGCLAGLRLIAQGGHGQALQVGFLLLAATTTTAMTVLAARAGVALRRAHVGTRDHARAARIAAGVSRPGPGGALIVESPRRGVYCLAGRPATIVITRAALQALDDDQVAAVIAHENAHLAGRHHQVLAITTALSKALPRVRLFSDGASEIARLLEMCADDAAARRHSADTVVDALLALTLPSPAAAVAISPQLTSASVTALNATAHGVTQRVERLLFPPDLTRARIALTAAIGAVLAGPAITAAVMTAVPVLCS
jgi:Zn-dependent protease with chaperone function